MQKEKRAEKCVPTIDLYRMLYIVKFNLPITVLDTDETQSQSVHVWANPEYSHSSALI